MVRQANRPGLARRGDARQTFFQCRAAANVTYRCAACAHQRFEAVVAGLPAAIVDQPADFGFSV